MTRRLGSGSSPRPLPRTRRTHAEGAATMSSRTTSAEWVDQLEQTLETFDETGGHRVLSEVFAELDLELALSEVVLPYLHAMGDRWSNGAIGVAQEHFASNVIRTRLSLLMNSEARDDGPLAVLACMPGEHHEFG